MRILGIELKRTTALVVGALIALLMVGLLYWGPSTKNSTAWTRQWTTLAEWVRSMLMFSWPLTLGAGALQGLRDRRSGVEELFSSTPRPRAQRIGWTLGALAVGSFAAFAVVLAVGGVQVSSDYFHWGWVPVALVGALALVGAAWLGMGLGRLLPSPLTPPVLAVLGLALMALGLRETVGGEFRWTFLLPSVPSPTTVFASVAGSASAVQALWFAGMASTGFLLVALRRWWLGALPLLVAGAVAVPLLPATPGEAVAADLAASELVCVEHLCLTRAHEGERAALAGPAREALRLLAKLPSPPTSVREVAAPVRPREGRGPEPADAVWVHLDEFTYFRREPPTDELVTDYLVGGAGTRTCYGQEVPVGAARELAARTVMTAWITGRYEPLPMYRSWLSRETDGLAERAWDHLRSLPEPDQAARVQAARDVQAACSGDAFSVLVAGAA